MITSTHSSRLTALVTCTPVLYARRGDARCSLTLARCSSSLFATGVLSPSPPLPDRTVVPSLALMPRTRTLDPLSVFDALALPSALVELGSTRPERHALVAWKHLLRTPGASLASLASAKGFPPSLVAPLGARFALLTSRVVDASTSGDGLTTKLLVELQDGLRVETVIIRHGAVTAACPAGDARTTLCVSSQVGCRMACTFCATGTMGEVGNLRCGEILEQVSSKQTIQICCGSPSSKHVVYVNTVLSSARYSLGATIVADQRQLSKLCRRPAHCYPLPPPRRNHPRGSSSFAGGCDPRLVQAHPRAALRRSTQRRVHGHGRTVQQLRRSPRGGARAPRIAHYCSAILLRSAPPRARSRRSRLIATPPQGGVTSSARGAQTRRERARTPDARSL